jgi:hypothetical protein
MQTTNRRLPTAAYLLLLGGQALCACSSSSNGSVTTDDSGTSNCAAQDAESEAATETSTGDAGGPTPDASPGDAATGHDAATAQDAAMDSAATDSGGGDASPQPVALNLCGVFDGWWPADLARSSVASWPLEFVQGPPTTSIPSEGYEALLYADCNVVGVIANVSAPDFTPWVNQLTAFEDELFGCPLSGADAGSIGFPLVPPNLYGQPLTAADLNRLSDWYLEAVIQAVTDQASIQDGLPTSPSDPALLTASQIDQIRQALAHYQTLYPNVIASTSFSQSMCPSSDAGAGGG